MLRSLPSFYKHFGSVAITLRGSISASDNNWAGILYDGKELYASKEYKIHFNGKNHLYQARYCCDVLLNKKIETVQ